MPRVASVEYAKCHDTRAAADEVVASLNANLKPGDDGKTPGEYRSYRIAIPAEFETGREVFVVAKQPSTAVAEGCKHFGVEVEGGKSIPSPANYVEMLSDEQQAELLKLLKAKKNAAK